MVSKVEFCHYFPPYFSFLILDNIEFDGCIGVVILRKQSAKHVLACQGQWVLKDFVCWCVSVCIWVHSRTLYKFSLSAVGPQHSAGPCRSLTFTELWERSGCPLLSASHLSLTEYDCRLYLLTMTGGQQVILRSSHAKFMLLKKVYATGFFFFSASHNIPKHSLFTKEQTHLLLLSGREKD